MIVHIMKILIFYVRRHKMHVNVRGVTNKVLLFHIYQGKYVDTFAPVVCLSFH